MPAHSTGNEDNESLELFESEIEKGLKAIEVQNKVLKRLLQETKHELHPEEELQEDEDQDSNNDESINQDK